MFEFQYGAPRDNPCNGFQMGTSQSVWILCSCPHFTSFTHRLVQLLLRCAWFLPAFGVWLRGCSQLWKITELNSIITYFQWIYVGTNRWSWSICVFAPKALSSQEAGFLNDQCPSVCLSVCLSGFFTPCVPCRRIASCKFRHTFSGGPTRVRNFWALPPSAVIFRDPKKSVISGKVAQKYLPGSKPLLLPLWAHLPCGSSLVKHRLTI